MDQQTSGLDIPEHVPASRVRDFDIYRFPVVDADAHRALHAISREAGAPATFWSPHNGGHWVVTRAASIEAVINDPDRFSNRIISVPKALNPVRLFRPLQLDPPDQIPYRNLISAALSPRMVQTLREDARALTIRLIEAFRARGECEFVCEFAEHMPIGIFMSIVGLPETDREKLLSIAARVIRPRDDVDRMQAYADMDAYSLGLLERRRGSGGGDFVTQLCEAEIDGAKRDDEELAGMLSFLMFAGLDTVMGMLGHILRFLAENPDRRRALIEQPALIPDAVEEMLRRFDHTVITREVRLDLEFDGAPMKAGDVVVVPLLLHNLDEAKFDDPLAIDFSRPRKPAHMTFGSQAHRCLGAMLARTELQIVVEEWLRRIPDFEIRPGATLSVRTNATWTLESLPLVWAAA